MSEYRFQVLTYNREVAFPLKRDMFGQFYSSVEFVPVNKLSVDVEAKDSTAAINQARKLTGRLYGEVVNVEPLGSTEIKENPFSMDGWSEEEKESYYNGGKGLK